MNIATDVAARVFEVAKTATFQRAPGLPGLSAKVNIGGPISYRVVLDGRGPARIDSIQDASGVTRRVAVRATPAQHAAIAP